MEWVKGGIGGLGILIGVVWIGQGLNFIHGSGMSGHPAFSFLGLVLAAAGLWLVLNALGNGRRNRQR